jgi:uroporphyrinogen-III synthase
MLSDALNSSVIAVAESRELDVFAQLLERRGASVWRCPLINILDAPDPTPVLGWLNDFCAQGCDDLILMTGEGLRRLLGCLDHHQPDRRPAFIDALKAVRRITRGPKPARELRRLGLQPDLEASTPTTAGVIATLTDLPLHYRRIGLQLYGTEPNAPLQDFLRQAGAIVKTVAPYIYAPASDQQAVLQLLEAMQQQRVHAITFTSQSQVDRLFDVASPATVLAALAQVEVASVGPLVSEALRTRGANVDAQPQANWSMKPLASALCALLSDTSVAATR